MPTNTISRSTKDDLQSIINSLDTFSSRKILVLGDIMLDVYDFCFTKDSKLIPSECPGKRAYRAHESIRVLGGAGNVAMNLASLQVPTTLIGITGNDGHYFTIKEIADQNGISHTFIRDKSRPTTVKIRLYVDDEYLLRRDDEATHEIDKETSTTIYTEVLREIETCDAVILSDYDKGFFTPLLSNEIISLAKSKNIPVIVDFKPCNSSYFKGAHLIVPNETEANAIQPGFKGSSDRLPHLQQLFTNLGCDNLIVTLGDKGLCGFNGIEHFYVQGNPVKAIDAVGCGDTVRASLALGIASGLTLQQSAQLANDAAGLIVQKRATATLTKDELREFLVSKITTI